MRASSYFKSLAVAASFALIAGCSSTGGTQDGSLDGAGGMGGGGADGSGVSGSGVSGQGMHGYGQQDAGRGQQDGSQSGIPQVRTIYFDYDRDTIRSEFEPVLNAHAQYLQGHTNTKVVLQGHTDERGTREYNLGLGERRANAVVRFMTVQGVPSSQMEVVSYGEERPAVRGGNEESYAQNRRVVFDY